MKAMSQKTVKRILHGLLAVAAFWWAADSYAAIGLGGQTFLFGAFGLWMSYSAASGAG